jgi:hypothetical protein
VAAVLSVRMAHPRQQALRAALARPDRTARPVAAVERLSLPRRLAALVVSAVSAVTVAAAVAAV